MQWVERTYQVEAERAVLQEWSDGVMSTLLHMATGVGKTVIIAQICRSIITDPGFTGRILIIVHRDELVTQMARAIRDICGLVPGIEQAESRADSVGFWSDRPQIVIGMIQTLSPNKCRRLREFDLPAFEYGVVDEAQHAVAPEYRRVFGYMPGTKWLHVTATVDRADEIALGCVVDTVAYTYELKDAIDDGWLVPVKQRLIHCDMDLSKVSRAGADLNQKQVAEIMEAEGLMWEIANETIASMGPNDRAIVFAASVPHAEMISEILNRPSMRPGESAFVYGGTRKDTRRRINSRFSEEDGDLRYYCNFGIATEGTDFPLTSVIGGGRPTESRMVYAQMSGRGGRTYPGCTAGIETAEERRAAIAASPKPSMLLLDFVGNSGCHKLITSVDLFAGEEPDEIVDRARKIVEEKGDIGPDEAIRLAAEERRVAAAERRANIHMTTAGWSEEIDPFDVLDIRPARERGWNARKPVPDGWKRVMARNAVPGHENFSYTKSKQIVDQIFVRRKAGQCSYRAAHYLSNLGMDSECSQGEANDILHKLRGAGWPTERTLVPEALRSTLIEHKRRMAARAQQEAAYV